MIQIWQEKPLFFDCSNLKYPTAFIVRFSINTMEKFEGLCVLFIPFSSSKLKLGLLAQLGMKI